MSTYSKNLQGFGAYSENQMQVGLSERDQRKERARRETNKYRNQRALDELQSDSNVCFSCFDCFTAPNQPESINRAWQEVTYQKMDEIFRQNNPD